MTERNGEYLRRGTDAIIDNLKSTEVEALNGDFIEPNKDSGSFSKINTPINGIEVDADDL